MGNGYLVGGIPVPTLAHRQSIGRLLWTALKWYYAKIAANKIWNRLHVFGRSARFNYIIFAEYNMRESLKRSCLFYEVHTYLPIDINAECWMQCRCSPWFGLIIKCRHLSGLNITITPYQTITPSIFIIIRISLGSGLNVLFRSTNRALDVSKSVQLLICSQIAHSISREYLNPFDSAYLQWNEADTQFGTLTFPWQYETTKNLYQSHAKLRTHT